MPIDITPILQDKNSGSYTYAQRMLELFAGYIAETGPRLSTDELFDAIHQAGRQLIKAQPNMVLVRRYTNTLISYFKRSIKSGRDGQELCDALVEKIADLQKEMAGNLEIIAGHGTKVITNFNKIMTISNSTAVRGILDEAIRQKRKFEVFVTTGQPPGEGIALAEYLAEKDVKVTLLPDAQIGMVMEEMNLVLVGADRLYETGFVNKAGTLPMSLVAEHHHVPVYLAAETTKVLKETERTVKQLEEDPAQVYEGGNKKIQVFNSYYEKIPFALVRKVICEEGVYEVREFQSWYLGD
ncbi:MAG: hypothetical protein D6677_06150 [Calditrichaeota bacterium]|nr:MAG: hypothetical protein D6677_06150 [Calditrichota bacterium]